MRGARKHSALYSAQALVDLAFQNHDRVAVCWSGGRCSTTVLWMALQLKPDVMVFHTDHGVHFPETREFWSTRELLKFIQRNQIPTSMLYKKRDRSGCWPCTAFVGWQEQLARTNFKFYKFLVERMGSQRLLEHFLKTKVEACSDRG